MEKYFLHFQKNRDNFTKILISTFRQTEVLTHHKIVNDSIKVMIIHIRLPIILIILQKQLNFLRKLNNLFSLLKKGYLKM